MAQKQLLVILSIFVIIHAKSIDDKEDLQVRNVFFQGGTLDFELDCYPKFYKYVFLFDGSNISTLGW